MTFLHLGDEPVQARLNLAAELRLLRRDPLGPVLDLIKNDEAVVLHRDAGRYVQALEFYVLSAERCLLNISIGTRYYRQVTPYLGGHRRLTPRRRLLSRQYSARARFFRLDLMNLLLHSRILLDRTITFSRRFLLGPELPSFSSFADHRKFFQKRPDALSPRHLSYARHIAQQTSWFDMLKSVRDKIVVHIGPPHFQFVTYPSSHDMGMFFALDNRQPWADYPQASSVTFSARRTIQNVREFLTWYSDYTVGALRDCPISKSKASNRFGGGDFSPRLPHHRTCGSASGGS
jgi:hypothetical protein